MIGSFGKGEAIGMYEWTVGSERVADVTEVTLAFIQKVVGGYQIAFLMKSRTHPWPWSEKGQLLIVPTSAKLWTGSPRLEFPIGRFCDSSLMSIAASPSEQWLKFYFDVPTNGLEELEAHRNGRNLDFTVEAEYFAVAPGTSEPRKRGVRETAVPGSTLDRGKITHRFDCSREDWTRWLNHCQFSSSLFVEVSIPKNDAGPHLGDSIDHLNRASRSYSSGQYESALIACRKALEALEESGHKRLHGSEGAGKPKKERSLSERVRALQASLHDVAHVAAHYDPGAEEIERHHVGLVLAATAALLRVVSRSRRVNEATSVSGPDEGISPSD